MLDRLALHAANRPPQTALFWPDGQLLYAELLLKVDAAIQLLRETGTGVLALDIGNGPAWVVLGIAAMQLEICLIPLPRFFPPGKCSMFCATAEL